MPQRNPFAAPTPSGPLLQTWWSPRAMGSRFWVDGHELEVQTHHWSGTEIYRIDGQQVRRVRNLGWHATEALSVGERSVEIVSRWYPLLPVQVRIDGRPHVDDLFPQLWPTKLALLALVSVGGPWLIWRLASTLGIAPVLALPW